MNTETNRIQVRKNIQLFNSFYPITILLTIAYLCIDIYVPVMHNIAEYFSVSMMDVKYFNTLYISGIFIPILFQSIFIDKLHKLNLMKYATYAFVLFSGLIIFVNQSFFFVCMLRLLQGFSASVVITASIPYFLDIYPENEMIKKLSEINTLITSALLLAPILAIGLISMLNLFAINGFIFLASLIGAFFLMNCPSIYYKQSIQKDRFKVYLKILHNSQFINLTIMYALSHALLLIFIFTSSFLVTEKTEHNHNAAVYQTMIVLAFVAGNAILRKLVEKYTLHRLFLFSYRILIIILVLIGVTFFVPQRIIILKMFICGYSFCFAIFTNLLVLQRAKVFAHLQKNAFVYTIGIFFRFLFGTALVLIYSISNIMLTTEHFLVITSTIVGITLSINAWFYSKSRT